MFMIYRYYIQCLRPATGLLGMFWGLTDWSMNQNSGPAREYDNYICVGHAPTVSVTYCICLLVCMAMMMWVVLSFLICPLFRNTKKESELNTATGHWRNLEAALNSKEAEFANLLVENRRLENEIADLKSQVSNVRPVASP